MKRAKKGIARATTIANTIATTMNIRGMNAWNTTRIATSTATQSAGGAIRRPRACAVGDEGAASSSGHRQASVLVFRNSN